MYISSKYRPPQVHIHRKTGNRLNSTYAEEGGFENLFIFELVWKNMCLMYEKLLRILRIARKKETQSSFFLDRKFLFSFPQVATSRQI